MEKNILTIVQEELVKRGWKVIDNVPNDELPIANYLHPKHTIDEVNSGDRHLFTLIDALFEQAGLDFEKEEEILTAAGWEVDLDLESECYETHGDIEQCKMWFRVEDQDTLLARGEALAMVHKSKITTIFENAIKIK